MKKKKNKINKKVILFLVCMLIIIILGLLFILFNQYSKRKINKYEYTIDLIESNECIEKPTLYFSKDNRNIYSYCLDNIKISYGNNTFELKEYIDDNNYSIDQIIEILTEKTSLKEANKVLYKDGGTIKYNNNNLSLIICNKELENRNINKNIYIGIKNMDYINGFCEN